MKTFSPWLLVLSLALFACVRDAQPDADGTYGPGGSTPVDAVETLVEALNTPDFPAAADYAVPGQAALASLSEGATFSQVADALRTGDRAVAANFWSGFAQGANSFLIGEIEVALGPSLEQDGVTFNAVNVTSGAGGRRIYLRDVDGFRVDIFASFGAGLADPMVPQVERLLSTQTDDARLILLRLKSIVPSLFVAAQQPELGPEAIQDLLRLIELITRVS
ncbi:MAG: hypothetical protein ACE5F5_09975 [Acidimicrobiia bacterium]